MAIFTESACVEWQVAPPTNISLNEAKYSFLPKFRQCPEMKKYMNDIREAENLLNSNGIESKTGCQKAFKLIFRLLDILWNIGSILTLPMCITIIGIPLHMLQRLYVWAAQTGEEVAIQSEADKIIAKMSQLVDHEKDPKKKKAYKEKLDKLIEKNKKFDDRERF